MIPYLKTFFDEKDLPYASWELEDKGGVLHIIDTEVVMEAIEIAPKHEQEAIAGVIRQIDFENGPVNLYLRHLAGALINR